MHERAFFLISIFVTTITLTVASIMTGFALSREKDLLADSVGSAYEIQIAVGESHCLFLNSDGRLWTWGSNNLEPKQIGIANNWKSIAAGSTTSFAIDNNGGLWSWEDSTLIPGKTDSNNWISVAAGANHAIGIDTDGKLWFIDNIAPLQIGTEDDWALVYAGDDNSFAINNIGELYAWGNDAQGTPAYVCDASDWVQFSTNGTYSFVIDDQGQLWSWEGVPKKSTGLSTTWKAVSVGIDWVFGITDSGELYLWEDIEETCCSIPTQIGTESDWVSVFTSRMGTDFCSFAVNDNGEVFAWGDNQNGMLGLGDNTDRPNPTMLDMKLFDVTFSIEITATLGGNTQNIFTSTDPTAITTVNFNAGTGYTIPKVTANLKIDGVNVGTKITDQKPVDDTGFSEIPSVAKYRAYYTDVTKQTVEIELKDINVDAYLSDPMVITAVAAPMTYTITFANLLTGTSKSPISYNITDNAIDLTPPTGKPTGVDLGKVFKQWVNEFGTPVTQVPKGSHGDKTFYAQWEWDTYTVEFPQSTMGYSIAPVTPYGSPVTHGYDFKFTVMVLTGYNQSTPIVKENGRTLTPSGNTYTIASVTENTTITVDNVIKNTYQVTKMTGTGYTIVAHQGYSFDTWPEHESDFKFKVNITTGYDQAGFDVYVNYVDSNSVPLAPSSGLYTISNITEAKHITIQPQNFPPNTYAVNFPQSPVGYSIAAVNPYTSPVTHNYDFKFTVSLLTGYTQSTPIVKENGRTLTLRDGVYTIDFVTEITDITVDGVVINKYNITARQGSMYMVFAESGYSFAPQCKPEHGEDFKFRVEVLPGYSQAAYIVYVNGDPLSAVSGVYTINSITEDQHITIEPETFQLNAYTITLPTNEDAYTITEVFWDNVKSEWVTKILDTIVTYENDFSFIVTMKTAYSDSQSTFVVKVDGTPIESVGGVYTIPNIDDDHEVNIENYQKNRYTITLPQTRTGYSVLPHGNTTDIDDQVIYGTDFTFTIKLHTPYNRSEFIVKADGNPINPIGGVYTISSVTQGFTITVIDVELNQYTVTFNTGSGSNISEQTITHFQKVIQPGTPPTPYGHSFGGWYADEQYAEIYDFNAKVTIEVTIYAKWNPNPIKLDFNTGSGSTVPTQTVYFGTAPVKPANPTLANHSFAGWYTTASYQMEFNFKAPVTEDKDITLYARWIPDKERLMNAKADAELAIAAGDDVWYTNAALQRWSKSILDAITLYNNSSATVQEINDAIKEMQDAVADLKNYFIADKIQELLDQQHRPQDYSFQSHKAYVSCWNTVSGYVKAGQYTLDGLKQHHKAIDDAITDLKPNWTEGYKLNKDELYKLILLIDDIIAGRNDDYTAKSALVISRKDLIDLFDDANKFGYITQAALDGEVLDNRSKLRVNLDDKYRELRNEILAAIDGIVVSNGEIFDLDEKYDPERLQAVQDALDKVNQDLANPLVALETIKQSIRDLELAASKLKLRQQPSPGLSPEIIGLIVGGAVFALGAAATVLIVRKKKKHTT